MRQAFVGFDAWTVKFDKILGVVSDGRSGLNLLGRSTPVSAFAGRLRGIFASFCRRIYTYAFEPELLFDG